MRRMTVAFMLHVICCCVLAKRIFSEAIYLLTGVLQLLAVVLMSEQATGVP